MAGRQPADGNLRAGELSQRYLDYHTNHSAPRTREFYARALSSFRWRPFSLLTGLNHDILERHNARTPLLSRPPRRDMFEEG